jgi:hypothetical protein
METSTISSEKISIPDLDIELQENERTSPPSEYVITAPEHVTAETRLVIFVFLPLPFQRPEANGYRF